MSMPGSLGIVDDGPCDACENCGAMIPLVWGEEPLCAECQQERDDAEDAVPVCAMCGETLDVCRCGVQYAPTTEQEASES